MTREEARTKVIGLLTAHQMKSNLAFEAIWYGLDEDERTAVAAELVALVSIQLKSFAEAHGKTVDSVLVDLGLQLAAEAS